jgi:hypothetical protein
MFICFTDAEGREAWINPIHVKLVRTRKGMLGGVKGAEIWFSRAAGAEAVNVPLAPAEVAAALNAAMPPVIAIDSGGEDDPQAAKTGP